MADQPDFKSFLITEYNSLAQAHFSTHQSLSSFFHYYILILGATITAVGIFVNFLAGKDSSVLLQATLPTAIFLFALSIVGLLLLWYISNLRFDAVLYARSVNGIRNVFYRESGLSVFQESYVRPLPKSISFPKYFEIAFFLPVVLTFAVLNCTSLFLSFWLAHKFLFDRIKVHNIHDFLTDTAYYFLGSHLASFILVVLFFMLHILVYYILSNYRENGYIRANTIGVDIDGVLNDHRLQFCRIFKKIHNRDLDPNKIVVIPVHDCADLQVSFEEELQVFHDPDYWVQMPAIKEAANVLRQLKESFGFSIHIITSRPWPILWRLPQRLFWKYFWIWSHRHVVPITKKWLRLNKFKYNKFTIEERNFTLFRLNAKYRNRFRKAAMLKFRVFIEDDLNKALRLSNLCELVFLFDQPYNQSEQLPSNVIRFKEWKDVIHNIRDLL